VRLRIFSSSSTGSTRRGCADEDTLLGTADRDALRGAMRSEIAPLLLAQHVAQLARERFATVGLAQQIDAWIQPTAVDERIIGITRRDSTATFGSHSRACGRVPGCAAHLA
jgi:hypothetical protein